MSLRLLALSLAGTVAACSVTSHPSQPGHLGISRRSSDMLAVIDRPGPVEVETVNSAGGNRGKARRSDRAKRDRRAS